MRLALFLFLTACSGGETAPAPAPEPAPEPAPVEAPAPEAAPAPTPMDAADVPKGDPAAGEAVYTTNCLACHQADGTGMGGMLAADFTKEKERLQKSDAELMTSIRDGVQGKKGVMPPWEGTLTPQEMADALAYIRKSFGGS